MIERFLKNLTIGAVFFHVTVNHYDFLQYPGKRNSDRELPEIPALLRVMLWLGLEKHQGEWEELGKSGGDLSLFAETVSLITRIAIKKGSNSSNS